MADEQTIGILVGAAPLGSEEEILKKITTDRKCKVTAVDGGLSFFVRNMAIEGTLGPDGYKAEGGCSTMAGLRPDYWIGDADSLAEGGVDISLVREIFPDLDIAPCSPIKDDSDMWLGAESLAGEGIKTILIFGGLGGERFDHSIANLQLLYAFAKKGICVILISESYYSFMLSKEGESITHEIRFKENENGYLSVLAFGTEAEVSVKNLYYEFEGILTPDKPLGLSNEFCGRGGEIRVLSGTVLVIRTGRFSPELLDLFR